MLFLMLQDECLRAPTRNTIPQTNKCRCPESMSKEEICSISPDYSLAVTASERLPCLHSARGQLIDPGCLSAGRGSIASKRRLRNDEVFRL
jgi:hypothetical protein